MLFFNDCCLRSGPVSIKIFFFDICKIADDLSLLSSFFFDLHTKHSHPITGIPCDVPVPRNLIFNFFN